MLTSTALALLSPEVRRLPADVKGLVGVGGRNRTVGAPWL
jgi:hypothetical protein